jgi:hypothetical protein
MRNQVAAVALLMLLCAGLGTSAILTRALAQPTKLSAIEQERLAGPRPTPRWYWRWQAWRLGEGYAKGHRLQANLRPKQAPHRIPEWAWRRLHFYLLARQYRTPAAAGKKGSHGSHTTTTGTTTTTTQTTTTTTTTTTTGTTTTTSSGDETYDQAIAYTQSRPGFVVVREVDVASAAAFRSALANLRAGDLVRATGPFTVSGETIIGNQLSAPAVLDLGSYVSFQYGGGQDYPAVWLHNASNLRIYGGSLTTDGTGGSCILSHGIKNVLWWGFYVHDCGGSGVGIMGSSDGGPTTGNDFQGEITRVGGNLNWDPHVEKGSGIHCVNLDDGGYFPFHDNRFAFYCHDIPTGAAIEYGSSRDYPPQNNSIYLKAVNLTYVSQIQTGGNAIQFWGINGQSADIKYLEVENAQGYGLFDGGMYAGTTLTGVTLEHGRATNTNQNPRCAGSPWRSTHGVVYRHLQPAPRAR